MKIYLMARYSRHPEMQEVAHRLQHRGHEVTSRWIWGKHQEHDAAIGTGTLGALEAQFANDDIEDLRQADICIGFSDPPRTISRGGRHAELGMAIILGKPIVVVGGHEHLFHALPQIIHVADTTALYALLALLTTWNGHPRRA